MGAQSAFGNWDVEHGLPVFREVAHPDEDACSWDPITGPRTNRHWCAVGNRRLQIVADNFGTTAIRDTAHGFRWLTRREPGTGVTLLRTETGEWGTDRPRWPSSWSCPTPPLRTWGPTWATLSGEHDGVRIERMVGCPEGAAARVLVRVRVVSDKPQRIELIEEWVLARDEPDAITAAGTLTVEARGSPAPDRLEIGSTDDGYRRVRLGWSAQLDGGNQLIRWVAVGLAGDDQLLADPDRTWSTSVEALGNRLPSASCSSAPAVEHEMPWHVALLTGGACVDEVLGGHTLDQGSAYSFDLGFNGAARDPLQHALPLVYSEPDLALSVLRNTCTWAGPDGALSYALDAVKRPIRDWFEPSDQALWSLWLAAEYGAATGDLTAFQEPTPFHPIYAAQPVPLVQHLIGQFRHFVDVVGIGAHGHVRIRNADWNDSALELAGIDRVDMQDKGESVLNSAMAAWVLPRFAGLLRRIDAASHAALADEADSLAAHWRDLVADEWNGRWYRRAHGPGAVVGDDDLWLEVQPWAILCGAADDARSVGLLDTIDALLRRDSPLGARLRGPLPIAVPKGREPGEGSAGGTWFSISMTLAWAARSLRRDLAWDELRRMTLTSHTSAYPAIWEGTISGPDSYNTPESPRPGHTWAWPRRGIGMQSFPVNNLHAHSQVVFTYLRLLGVEPECDGALRVGDGGAFRSSVFELTADGHGAIQTPGQVVVRSTHGEVHGAGRSKW